MILATLLLLLPQSGDLKAAVTEATAQASRGQFAAAVATLEEAGALKSKNVEALTSLGTYMLRNAEAKIAAGTLRGLEINDAFLQAGYVLEDASKLSGAPVDSFENWSEALLNGGDKKNALRAAEAGVKAYSNQASALMQRARVHVALANDTTDAKKKGPSFDAAIADYRAAMKLDSKNAAACLKLGETTILASYAELEGGNPAAARKEAAKAWEEALKRDRSAVDLAAMGQWLHGEAVPLLQKIDKSKGTDATMTWYMGYAEYAGQPRNWDEVRKHFEKALELEPTMYNCHFFLAQGAYDRGSQLLGENNNEMSPQARNAYLYSAAQWGKYLEYQGPTHSASVVSAADGGAAAIEIFKWVAGQAVGAGRFEPAIQISKWITQTFPSDVEAWNNLAFLYRDSGQAEKSLAAYAKSAELAPEDPQVLNDWAVIYHYYLKTEDEKAKGLYKKAIRLAEEILADETGLSSEDKQRIQIGLRDAVNNLAKLEAGNRRNG
jgi:tetratricopeptide (TPR) repeat protein